MPGDLNLRMGQRVSVVITFILIIFAFYLAVRWRAVFLIPLLANMFILLAAYWMEASLTENKVMRGIVGATLA